MWAVLLGNVHSTNAQSSETKPWPVRLYNPNPADDDFILPMPCGGAMVFRPVDVASASRLDDKAILLGGRNPAFDYAEAPRQGFVAGTLPSPKGDSVRRYYLAKYETLQIQWSFLMGLDCGKIDSQSSLPKTDVSWFDAVQFANRYTAWLMLNAKNQLPKNENEIAFLSLPTEDEWEYAARGGNKVEASKFRDPTYFSGESSVNENAWHDSTSSANGKAQRVGLLNANQLQLYDMLGNVEEIVMEGFRLNHPGRLHGATGGFITKGGHFFTSAGQIRASYRRERNHFDSTTGEPNRSKTVGLRLKISAPVLASKNSFQKIQNEWARLPQIDSGQGAQGVIGIQDLDAISDRITDDVVKAALADFSQKFASAVALRNDQRDRAIGSYLRLGGFLADKLKDDSRRMDGIRTAYDGIKQLADGGTDVGDRLDRFQEALDAGGRIMDETTTYYADVVVALVDDYSSTDIDEQFSVQILDLNATGQASLVPFVEGFRNHVKEYRATKIIDKSRWVSIINGIVQ